VIAERGGRWVDGEYRNNRTEIYIDCGKGHSRVSITPNSLLSGSWCRKCDPTKKPKNVLLKELVDLAVERGGHLLSSEYLDAKTKLKWKCGKCDFEWEATPDSVKGGGSWCSKCNGGVAISKEDYEIRAKNAVKALGGSYERIERVTEKGKIRTSVHYTCQVGHPCRSELNHLEHGHGCNTCNLRGVTETVCRAILEHLFASPFDKARPRWLVSTRGTRLELDGYNKNLGLAFEYQGQQHYQDLPFFYRTEGEFEQRIQWDEKKRQLCHERGVLLIEIPYWVKIDALQEFITEKLDDSRRALIQNGSHLDISKVETGRSSELNRLRKIAEDRGGSLLSESYISSQTPLLWHCGDDDHDPWEASPSSVLQGTWCRQCANESLRTKRRTPIAEIKKLLALRCWELLGEDVEGSGIKYLVRCGNNHEFLTDVQRLRKPLGCQKCGKLIAGRKYSLSIDDLTETAKKKLGQLLSRHYVNNRQKLVWQCQYGHRWQATGNSVKQNRSWCPTCGKNKAPMTDVEVKLALATERDFFERQQIELDHALQVRKKILEAGLMHKSSTGDYR
jgi:hypothetical protein